MGQAKNRGTYEQRKTAAITRAFIAREARNKEVYSLRKAEAAAYAKLTPKQRLSIKRQAAMLKSLYTIPLGLLDEV